MSKGVIITLKIFSVVSLLIIFCFAFYLKSERGGYTKPTEINQVQAQTTSCDAMPNNWPQIGRNPQHTGDSPESLGSNFPTRTWTHAFQPDKIYPQVQAIIYCGKLFIGTEGANGKKPALYAFDAQGQDTNGDGKPDKSKILWTYEADGPILGSVAASHDTVVFADMNDNVYALDATQTSTPVERWRTSVRGFRRYGFSMSPVIVDNRVFLGNRNGTFYALDLSNGDIIWQKDMGTPLLQTAAADDTNVYFGGMNMHTYALNQLNGSQVWDSGELNGAAFKDYWPVVYGGYVFNRAMAFNKNFFALDITTGVDQSTAINLPQDSGQTMNGATTPPCVDGDGRLIIPQDITETQPVAGWTRSGWGRFDLSTQTIQRLVDPNNVLAGNGNYDENMNVTCVNNLIFAMHTQEGNANYTGVFNLTNITWTPIGTGHTNRQMFTNTQGGGGNPPSISNGWFYHISIHELIARNTN